MTVAEGAISVAAPDWLELRAAADDAARSRELADGLAALVPPGHVTVHDLGAGTGAMTRWLAARLPGSQRWVLHDGDAGILSHLDLRSVVDGAGRTIATEVRVERLADLPPDAFVGAAAVTASALLDVITSAEAARVVAACVAAETPALFSLSVTGAVRLDPPDELDRLIGAAFDGHQRREVAGRRLLGPDAASLVVARFAAAGWNVRTARTPWRLGPESADLLLAWLDGWIAAAVEQRPGLAPAAREYRRSRRSQAAADGLRAVVSHEDLLAWPR